jgi:leucyl-tRNA synthetase
VWPQIDKKYLKKEIINIVIQVNGKKRSIIKANANINEKDIIDKSKKDSQILKYIKDKKIAKIIYVKNRLLNLIVK